MKEKAKEAGDEPRSPSWKTNISSLSLSCVGHISLVAAGVCVCTRVFFFVCQTNMGSTPVCVCVCVCVRVLTDVLTEEWPLLWEARIGQRQVLLNDVCVCVCVCLCVCVSV